MKKKIYLNFINSLLENIGKDKITKFSEFVDIDRDDIIKKVNIDLLKENLGTLLFLITEKKRFIFANSEGIVLNVLRAMCSDIGYVFKGRQVDTVLKEGKFKGFRKIKTQYSILS